MKFLGYKNLSLDEVISPSPWNPRLKGLSPDEPAIQALADSIKKEGQLHWTPWYNDPAEFMKVILFGFCIGLFIYWIAKRL